MKIKFGIKQIVLAAVAVVLVAILIAGNVILDKFSPVLHAFFAPVAGGSVNVGGAHGDETPYEYGARLSEEAEEDSIVLLENEDVDGKPYLPLSASTRFSIFGYGATDTGFILSGGGSGGTNTNIDSNQSSERPRTTLYQAFDEADIEYYGPLAEAYTAFSSNDADYNSGGYTGENKGADKAPNNPNAKWYTDNEAIINDAKEFSDGNAIVVFSRMGNENGGGGELKSLGSFSGGSYLELTANERALLQTLQDKGFNVTLLLNTTNYIEMGFLDDYDCIKAVLAIGAPGQSGAKAIPNLLVGSKLVDGEEVQISPSGKLSDTLANDWQDAPSYNNVALTGNVAYAENIYVGYKWYETADAEGFFESKGGYDKVVRYPFGHGLSYTTFEQTIKEIKCDGKTVKAGDAISEDGTYSVTVTVKNTGTIPAKDVIQLYYTPEYHEGGIEKASINLLAFTKTGVIEAGKSEDYILTFTAYDMAAYDDYDKNQNGFCGYEIDAGQYDIKLMKNAHEAYENQSVSLRSDGFTIENDPFTGTEVKNLFTGDTAYAKMPVDGSKGLTTPVDYLSRAGGFSNYANATKAVSSTNSAASTAKSFEYNGDREDKAQEVSGYVYADESSYKWPIMKLEDGSTPTRDDLNGKNKSVLVVDKLSLVVLIADPEEEIWKLVLDSVSKTEINEAIQMKSGTFGADEIVGVAKPATRDKDGPSGFNDNIKGGEGDIYPFYPVASMLGCSWNIDMMREIGRAQGLIAVQKGIQGWYAPGVNLHRSPYNSRNYEYFSEDGVLSGWLAAGIINGSKEEGLYCYLKHFALAESGQNSNEWFEWITEQALRENYCKPFEIAVKVSIDPDTGRLMKNVRVSYEEDAPDPNATGEEEEQKGKLVTDPNGRLQTGANAIMSAFNCVGGIWSGYNHALLTDMLREEWGFQGTVLTDYGQGYMFDFDRGVKAGNNLWMTTSKQNVSLNFNDVGVAYGARESIRGILFTYLDTIYTSGLETTVAAESPYSVLFVSLWAIIDVVLVLGIGACVLFFFWSPRKKKLAPEGGESEAPAGEGGLTEPQPPEEAPEETPPTE